MGGKRFDEKTKKKAIKMREKGKSFKEIAQKLGTTSGTISRWCKQTFKFSKGGIVPLEAETVDYTPCMMSREDIEANMPDLSDDYDNDSGFRGEQFEVGPSYHLNMTRGFDFAQTYKKKDLLLKDHMNLCIRYRVKVDAHAKLMEEANELAEEINTMNKELKQMEMSYEE